MKEKKCSRCKKVKPVSDFAKNKSRKDGLQNQCKECRKKEWGKIYSENREYYIEKRKRTVQRNRERLRNIKEESICNRCGESENCCLVFHHIDPKLKDDCLANAYNWSDKRFFAELEKCECLCANCQRKEHAGLVKPDII